MLLPSLRAELINRCLERELFRRRARAKQYKYISITQLMAYLLILFQQPYLLANIANAALFPNQR